MKFNYKNTSGIGEGEIKKVSKEFVEYFDVLKKASKDDTYSMDESMLYLADDKKMRKQVLDLADKYKSDNLKEVMVIGIGGSNLGTWAVEDALQAHDVRLSYFDTAHARSLNEAKKRMKAIFDDGNHVLLNIVSKSGSTNETVMNAHVLLKELQSITDGWRDYVVATTQPESKLEAWAQKNNIDILPNPKTVSGRYSVLCPVGMFPLALAGVDIEKLHKGASKMLDACLKNDDENPALLSCACVWNAMQNQSVMHNLFLFDMDLERIGKWFRQLTAESLGKQGKGIMPIVSIGSTDLHSVYQIFLDGPKNVFTTFVSVKKGDDIDVPPIDEQMDAIVPELRGKSAQEVMSAIYEGTKGSYQKHGLPFCEAVLDDLREE
ncbi:MAG: hypothetical protein CO042_04640, partial [Parcubacteria group bacterium CG_4_9_14_0_2_um_filter_41_8]